LIINKIKNKKKKKRDFRCLKEAYGLHPAHLTAKGVRKDF